MDISLLTGQQTNAWSATMINLEARKLINTANMVAANLLEQDRLLRTKAAQLYARVEFIKENNKVVGYVISAVEVVFAGLQAAGGLLLASSMTPVGVL